MDKQESLVQCPNLCHNGKERYTSPPGRALWDLRLCPYCRGRGQVTTREARKINKTL